MTRRNTTLFVVGWNTTDMESGTRIPVIGYTDWYHREIGGRIRRIFGDSGPMFR